MSTNINPIQDCLWFNRTDYFMTRIRPAGGDGVEYLFPGATEWKFVIKYIDIDDHTFFLIEGYQ